MRNSPAASNVGRAVVALAAVVGLGSAPLRGAYSSPPNILEVQAAFLYHFAEFIEWPATAAGGLGSPLVFGILGADPFDGALDRLVAGQNLDGRPLIVRRAADAEDLKGCNIVYINGSDTDHLPHILDILKGSSVVTVSDMPHFANLGGTIRLLVRDDKLQFEINVDTARRAGVQISSKLLQLATIIHD